MKPFRPGHPEPPAQPIGAVSIAAALAAPAVAFGSFLLFDAGLIGEIALLIILIVVAAAAGLVLLWLECVAARDERSRQFEILPPHDVIATWPFDEDGFDSLLDRRPRRSPGRKPRQADGA